MALTGTVSETFSDQSATPGDPDSGRWTIYSSHSQLTIIDDAGTPRLRSLCAAASPLYTHWLYTAAGKWASGNQKITIQMHDAPAAAGDGIGIGLMANAGSTAQKAYGYFLWWGVTPNQAPTSYNFRIVLLNDTLVNWNGLASLSGGDANRTVSINDTISLERIASSGTLIARHNGTQILSATDATLSDFGYPALCIHRHTNSTSGGYLQLEGLSFTDAFLPSGGASPLRAGMDPAWNCNMGHP